MKVQKYNLFIVETRKCVEYFTDKNDFLVYISYFDSFDSHLIEQVLLKDGEYFGKGFRIKVLPISRTGTENWIDSFDY